MQRACGELMVLCFFTYVNNPKIHLYFFINLTLTYTWWHKRFWWWGLCCLGTKKLNNIWNSKIRSINFESCLFNYPKSRENVSTIFHQLIYSDGILQRAGCGMLLYNHLYFISLAYKWWCKRFSWMPCLLSCLLILAVLTLHKKLVIVWSQLFPYLLIR